MSAVLHPRRHALPRRNAMNEVRHAREAHTHGTHHDHHRLRRSAPCQSTDACADCLVTFLLDREPDDAVVIDAEEARALRLLERAGLAPHPALRGAGRLSRRPRWLAGRRVVADEPATCWSPTTSRPRWAGSSPTSGSCGSRLDPASYVGAHGQLASGPPPVRRRAGGAGGVQHRAGAGPDPLLPDAGRPGRRSRWPSPDRRRDLVLLRPGAPARPARAPAGAALRRRPARRRGGRARRGCPGTRQALAHVLRPAPRWSSPPAVPGSRRPGRCAVAAGRPGQRRSSSPRGSTAAGSSRSIPGNERDARRRFGLTDDARLVASVSRLVPAQGHGRAHRGRGPAGAPVAGPGGGDRRHRPGPPTGSNAWSRRSGAPVRLLGRVSEDDKAALLGRPTSSPWPAATAGAVSSRRGSASSSWRRRRPGCPRSPGTAAVRPRRSPTGRPGWWSPRPSRPGGGGGGASTRLLGGRRPSAGAMGERGQTAGARDPSTTTARS